MCVLALVTLALLLFYLSVRTYSPTKAPTTPHWFASLSYSYCALTRRLSSTAICISRSSSRSCSSLSKRVVYTFRLAFTLLSMLLLSVSVVLLVSPSALFCAFAPATFVFLFPSEFQSLQSCFEHRENRLSNGLEHIAGISLSKERTAAAATISSSLLHRE